MRSPPPTVANGPRHVAQYVALLLFTHSGEYNNMSRISLAGELRAAIVTRIGVSHRLPG
jgi:hypothetical protein